MAPQQILHRRAEPRDLIDRSPERVDRGGEFVSPYLDTGEACDYLRFRGRSRLRSLYRFIKANGVPVYRTSPRSIRLRRADLDAVLRRGGKGRG